MKMFFTLLLLAASTGLMQAQMASDISEVQVIIGGSTYPIEKSSTQTEVQQGWDVVGFNIGGRTIKYLWGKQSRQSIDNPTPFFLINPQKGAALSDFVVMKLRKKRLYRQFFDSVLRDNEYVCIDLVHFSIELTEDNLFLVRPQQKLTPGEYILLNINQAPHGELQDYYGYCFTIE